MAENQAGEKDYKEEMQRIISVNVFAVGILAALITIFPGSAGWNTMHNVLWGVLGWGAPAISFIMIYESVLIGLGKSYEEIFVKALRGLGWTAVASSTVQLFAVGSIPGDDFLDYIVSMYNEGSECIGGGVIALPLAGILFGVFGKMGARIVILIFIGVLIILMKGKSAADMWNLVWIPLQSAWSFFISNDSEDDEEDEDDYDDYEEGDGYEDDIIIHIPNPVPPPPPPPPPLPTSEEQELDLFFGNQGAKRQDEQTIDIDISFSDDKKEKEEERDEQPESSERSEDDGEGGEVDPLDVLINNAAKKDRQPEQSEELEEPTEAAEDDSSPEEDEEKPYVLPPVELLTPPSVNFSSEQAAAEMHEKADIIVKTLASFSVKVEIVDIYRGPSITRYEVRPGAGVKVSKIKGLEDDIALNLAAQGVRIEAPVPGKSAVGIEVPNTNKDVVTLREIISSEKFRKLESKLTFAVGKDITGEAIIGDIAKMPHIIIAGTTGSGKSVCTRSIIMSILYNAKPDEVKFILIDPKVVEFKVFDGIPHLLIPIVTEAKKAAGALNWAVNEMMRRYNTFANVGANDIKSYNELAEEDENLQFMHQIVIFIDELADLMLVAGKEVEELICRLAQMGRAAGMHLVVATQRPTTDVITGLIKANIPSRIALSVMSQVDSRTIIDTAGADKLLGNGDMLFMPINENKPKRVQGCFASPKDIINTLNFIKSQSATDYNSQVIDAVENFVPNVKGSGSSGTGGTPDGGTDEDYIIRAAEIAVNSPNGISVTMIQKKLKLGYARASRIMDELEECGIVAPSEGAKPRRVLMSKMQFDEWKLRKLE